MAELLLLAIVLLGTCLLTGIIRPLALGAELLDVPTGRSSHYTPTPIGGGLSIAITFVCALIYMYWSRAIPGSEFAALLGGTLIAALGFVDDFRPIRVVWRIIIQLFAALWALYFLGGLPPVQIAGFSIELSWIGYVLGALALVWLLNLYNFMDGIDGLAGSETCFVTAVTFFILLHNGDRSSALLSGILLMGSVGFLIWNWPPAKIFMGDAGSSFLGYSLGVLALITLHHGSMNIGAWVLLLGVFITDATVTLLRRVSKGENWYLAHCSHAYQHAARRYASHGRVSIFVFLINGLWLFPLAWFAVLYPETGIYLAILGLSPLIFIAMRMGAGRESIVENY